MVKETIEKSNNYQKLKKISTYQLHSVPRKNATERRTYGVQLVHLSLENDLERLDEERRKMLYKTIVITDS